MNRTVDTETQRLRELFNLLNDGIIVMNPKRIIVFVNPAATKITGWELGDTIPYCIHCEARVVHPGEERCFLASQLEQSYFESELPTKTGQTVPVGMSRTFLSKEVSTHRDMVITIRDVTIERQAKELETRAQLNQRTLEVQEQERKRISQELHDGISQTLYGINLNLEHLRYQIPEKEEQIMAIHKQVQLCADEVRLMSRTLYPAVLYDLGLSAAIRTLAAQMRAKQRQINVDIQSSWKHDDLHSNAIHVYRIVQEALHNALHHGHATQIDIHLSCQIDCIVSIEDNGCGFNPQTISENPGYGLKNMRERASALNGALTIDSAPQKGTKIQVCFPHP